MLSREDFAVIDGLNVGDRVLIKSKEWFERNLIAGSNCVNNIFIETDMVVTPSHARIFGKEYTVKAIARRNNDGVTIKYEDSTWEIPYWMIEKVM